MRRRSYYSVPLDEGESMTEHAGAAHLEFDSCLRQSYTYLEKLGRNHNGFAFPPLQDIADHTWNKLGKCHYSIPEVKRALRLLRVLGVIGDYTTKQIPRKGMRHGWQVYPHMEWAGEYDGYCCFKRADVAGTLKRPVLPVLPALSVGDPQSDPQSDPDIAIGDPQSDPGQLVRYALSGAD